MEETSMLLQLQKLNDLLLRERIAISNLQMDRLSELQQDKTALLATISQSSQSGEAADAQCRELAARVKANNLRNGWLLRSGLKLVGRLQALTRRKLAVTYTAHGRALQIEAGPKVFTRRV